VRFCAAPAAPVAPAAPAAAAAPNDDHDEDDCVVGGGTVAVLQSCCVASATPSARGTQWFSHCPALAGGSFAPSKVADVANIINMFEQQEGKLFDALEAKYGQRPNFDLSRLRFDLSHHKQFHWTNVEVCSPQCVFLASDACQVDRQNMTLRLPLPPRRMRLNSTSSGTSSRWWTSTL
jgi:hypothetical protein